MLTKIYALTDESGKIRYIGKTAKTLHLRLLKHFKDVRRGLKNHRCNWIRSLLARGILPTITEIGEVEGDGCKEEIAWIKYFRDEGVDLTNTTNGGDGFLGHKGWPHSVEARRKMSIARKGIHLSDETKAKLRAINKGKTISPEVRRKMGESRRLYYSTHEVSAESRRKTGAAHIGNTYMLGHHHTPETKQKMRDAIKNNPARMEQIRNLGFSSRGRTKGRL